MKIGILTSWLSHRSGGPLRSGLSRAWFAACTPIRSTTSRVFGLADHCTAAESERAVGGPSMVSFPTHGPDYLRLCPGGWAAALESADLDILHVHGLWMYYSIAQRGLDPDHRAALRHLSSWHAGPLGPEKQRLEETAGARCL